MRIGLVIPNPPGYSETFFHSKIKGLQEHSHEVVLFVGHQRGGIIETPCEIRFAHRVDSRIPILQFLRIGVALAGLVFRVPFVACRFWKLERANGASVRKIIERLYINAHILHEDLDWIHFGFMTMTVGRENVAKAIGAKMAVSFRGYDVCIYPVKNGMDCYKQVWPKLNKLHTISDDLLNIALNKLGLDKDIPVDKITPAIDEARFRRDSLKGPMNSPIRLLTIARLTWKKGLDYAIEACAQLKLKGVDFKYSIIGCGDAYEQLKFLIHLLGLEDWISLAGKKTPDEVADLMRSSDIYMQPSVSEGFCNAVLEAQAAGLLCIVSDAEGLPENVIDGETGWVVPKRDSGALADKCLEVIGTGKEVRQQIRKNAVARVKNEFSLDKHINSWMSFYK